MTEMPLWRHLDHLRAIEDAAVAEPDTYDEIMEEVSNWRTRVGRVRRDYLVRAGGIDWWQDLEGAGSEYSDQHAILSLARLPDEQLVAIGRLLEIAARDRAWKGITP